MKMLRLATIPEDDSVCLSCLLARAPRFTRRLALRPDPQSQATALDTVQPLTTVTSLLEPIYHFTSIFLLFQTPLTLLGMGLFALSH